MKTTSRRLFKLLAVFTFATAMIVNLHANFSPQHSINIASAQETGGTSTGTPKLQPETKDCIKQNPDGTRKVVGSYVICVAGSSECTPSTCNH